MNRPTIIAIIEKYSTGTLSAEEAFVLDGWLVGVSAEEFNQTLDLCERLPEGLENVRPMPPEFSRLLEERLNGIESEDGAVTVRLFTWRKWAAAAAVVFLLLSGGYFLTRKSAADIVQPTKNDVAPGIDGAILTLASGKQIVLDSVHNGSLATEGNTMIEKTNEGELTYRPGTGHSEAILYNTVTTPRGRKTSVVLADGSRVWLNAASSIKFPTAFAVKDRSVEISGEAYFEVAENKVSPFIVKKAGCDYSIQVLGTHFNVNAYDDEEAIRTTLLEGAVKIRNGSVSRMLKPGEQATVSNGQSDITVLPDANLTTVMAWKNGIFSFDRADIHSVMRQVARWYNVNVEYKGTISQHFGGTISRDVNVSQVFKMLELTGAVRFNIDGHKIEVMP